MTRVAQASGRMEFLDSLRGIAALSVAIYHLFSSCGPLAFYWLFSLQNTGEFAVVTFFFVSGFIIPVSLERHTLAKFWVARFFRLVPAYWFTLALALLCGSAGLLTLSVDPHHLRVAGIVANLAMVAGLIHQPAILSVAWTLGLELIFYILCTGLKACGLLGHRIAVVCAGIACYLAWLLLAQHHILNPLHFKGSFGSLLLAAFTGSVFYAVQSGDAKLWQAYLLMGAAVIASCWGLRFEYAVPRPVHPEFEVPFTAAAWAVILAALLFCALFGLRAHTFPAPLLWLGRISYSLYLLHALIAPLLDRPLSAVSPYLRASIQLVVSLAAAALSYRFIEIPGLRLARGAHRNQPPV